MDSTASWGDDDDVANGAFIETISTTYHSNDDRLMGSFDTFTKLDDWMMCQLPSCSALSQSLAQINALSLYSSIIKQRNTHDASRGNEIITFAADTLSLIFLVKSLQRK